MNDTTGADREDIAIVGMSCRFPGAGDLNRYWELLTAPSTQFDTVPDTRWRRDGFFSTDLRDSHSVYTDTMALLPDVDQFDAAHYRIPPRRARAMDPQHRLLVDLAREAVQDAGWEADGFDSEHTSVMMALTDSGYREISTLHLRMRQLAGGEFGAAADELPPLAGAVDALQGSSVAGLLMNMGPSTVSSVLGLHGESYALDAACSGGLLAVANAVHALRTGRCRIALAGGAQLMLTPDLLVGLCRIGAVSPSGTCRPFGAGADGFVLGEGAGVLVLRPLADALAAGDRVYAVVRGVGTGNDGKVSGGMYPRPDGQLRVLRRAYRDAGLAPDAADFLESHGTGTHVGDQSEIGVLGELRGERAAPAYLGAVKAVLGHSLGAAGIAGLIKTVLAVQKGRIPPQPEYEPAEHLGLDAARLTVPTAVGDWPERGPVRRAAVSAFGFGGTGVHLVLEESPQERAPQAADDAQLLVLSARDRAGLARYARDVARALTAEEAPLPAVTSTLAHRGQFEHGLAVVADSTAHAATRLTTAAASLEAGRSGELGPGQTAGTVRPGTATPKAALPAPGSLPPRERTAALERLAREAVSGAGLKLSVDRTPPH
ncbi:polyketide synthase, partial [Streptomyces boncukensis]